MLNKPNYKFICETLLEKLQEESEFIYIMGSVGTEKFHDKSDIDVAVYWKKVPELDKIFMIKNNFENIFDREVELVNLNSIDFIFARQVLETGRLIFVNPLQKGLLLKWRAQKMSEYPDFKYSRKIIEENILVRKKYV